MTKKGSKVDVRNIIRDIIKINKKGRYLQLDDRDAIKVMSKKYEIPVEKLEFAKNVEDINKYMPFACFKNTRMWVSEKKDRTIHYGFNFDLFETHVHVIAHCFGRENGIPREITPFFRDNNTRGSVVLEDDRIKYYFENNYRVLPQYCWLMDDKNVKKITKVESLMLDNDMPIEYSMFCGKRFIAEPLFHDADEFNGFTFKKMINERITNINEEFKVNYKTIKI
jgi:hypothetical protein